MNGLGRSCRSDPCRPGDRPGAHRGPRGAGADGAMPVQSWLTGFRPISFPSFSCFRSQPSVLAPILLCGSVPARRGFGAGDRCPCALGMATRSRSSRNGCRGEKGHPVQGRDVLERMHKVNSVVLDKTGTLTAGRSGCRRYGQAPRSRMLTASFSASPHLPNRV